MLTGAYQTKQTFFQQTKNSLDAITYAKNLLNNVPYDVQYHLGLFNSRAILTLQDDNNTIAKQIGVSNKFEPDIWDYLNKIGHLQIEFNISHWDSSWSKKATINGHIVLTPQQQKELHNKIGTSKPLSIEATLYFDAKVPNWHINIAPIKSNESDLMIKSGPIKLKVTPLPNKDNYKIDLNIDHLFVQDKSKATFTVNKFACTYGVLIPRTKDDFSLTCRIPYMILKHNKQTQFAIENLRHTRHIKASPKSTPTTPLFYDSDHGSAEKVTMFNQEFHNVNFRLYFQHIDGKATRIFWDKLDVLSDDKMSFISDEHLVNELVNWLEPYLQSLSQQGSIINIQELTIHNKNNAMIASLNTLMDFSKLDQQEKPTLTKNKLANIMAIMKQLSLYIEVQFNPALLTSILDAEDVDFIEDLIEQGRELEFIDNTTKKYSNFFFCSSKVRYRIEQKQLRNQLIHFSMINVIDSSYRTELIIGTTF